MSRQSQTSSVCTPFTRAKAPALPLAVKSWTNSGVPVDDDPERETMGEAEGAGQKRYTLGVKLRRTIWPRYFFENGTIHGHGKTLLHNKHNRQLAHII